MPIFGWSRIPPGRGLPLNVGTVVKVQTQVRMYPNQSVVSTSRSLYMRRCPSRLA